MAKTPESKVKDAVKAILVKHDAWFFMPVPTGFGATTLDFHCAHPITGRAFMIETKSPNGKLTAMQCQHAVEAIRRNVLVLFIDGGPGGRYVGENVNVATALRTITLKALDVFLAIGDPVALKPRLPPFPMPTEVLLGVGDCE